MVCDESSVLRRMGSPVLLAGGAGKGNAVTAEAQGTIATEVLAEDELLLLSRFLPLSELGRPSATVREQLKISQRTIAARGVAKG